MKHQSECNPGNRFFRFRILHFILSLLIIQFSQCAGTQKTNPKNGLSSTIDGKEIVPREYKTIYVHNFRNQTFDDSFTGLLKDQLILQFQLDRRFLVVSKREEAELYVYGQIDYFEKQPRNSNEFGEVTSYNLTIIASVWVTPVVVPGKNSTEGTSSSATDNVVPDKKSVRYDTYYSPRIPPFESEFVARERLIRGLSERIRTVVIKGWYSDLKTGIEKGKADSNPLKQN